MKSVRRYVSTALMLLLSGWLFASCEPGESLAPRENTAENASTHGPAPGPAALKLNSAAFASDYGVFAAKQISKTIFNKKGSLICLNYDGGKDGLPELNVDLSLMATPGMVDEEQPFTLRLEVGRTGRNLYLIFSPHGMVFRKPLLLNLEASGLNFRGRVLSDIGLFYDNNGRWEKMKAAKIFADTQNGSIKIVNGILPHFSRYAIVAE